MVSNSDVASDPIIDQLYDYKETALRHEGENDQVAALQYALEFRALHEAVRGTQVASAPIAAENLPLWEAEVNDVVERVAPVIDARVNTAAQELLQALDAGELDANNQPDELVEIRAAIPNLNSVLEPETRAHLQAFDQAVASASFALDNYLTARLGTERDETVRAYQRGDTASVRAHAESFHATLDTLRELQVGLSQQSLETLSGWERLVDDLADDAQVSGREVYVLEVGRDAIVPLAAERNNQDFVPIIDAIRVDDMLSNDEGSVYLVEAERLSQLHADDHSVSQGENFENLDRSFFEPDRLYAPEALDRGERQGSERGS